MFEVDLLIPFLNEEQKRQFIRQFLEIRRQKHEMMGDTFSPQDQAEDIEWIRDYRDIRKFSFNASGFGDEPRSRKTSHPNPNSDVWINELQD
jgi:hypothetical protein